jgi:hypothetical protein
MTLCISWAVARRVSARLSWAAAALVSTLVVGAPAEAAPAAPIAPPVGSMNVAKGKPATQSSTAYGGLATRAVDGTTDGLWSSSSVTHTDLQAQPWWQVDLGYAHGVSQVVIYNRAEVPEWLSNFKVLFSNDGSNWTTAATYPGTAPAKVSLPVTGSPRYVRVQLNGTNYLSLAEVEVYDQPSPKFGSDTVYNWGNGLTNVFTGDFNGDGLWDIGVTATENQGDRSWYILYGDGHGNFANPTVFHWGNGLTNAFTGDFNGDGFWDIGVTATENQGDRSWYILYGDGRGNFGNLTVFHWGNGLTNAFTGDFNGDGFWDIGVTATENQGDRSWYILYGDGRGNFGNQTVYNWGNGLTNAFTGDFNGDGYWDIGVTGTADQSDRAWYILYGDGRGNFGAQTRYFWGNGLTNVFTGDFNGDHKWDIGVTGTAEQANGHWYIRYNNGTQSLSPPTNCSAPTGGNPLYAKSDSWGNSWFGSRYALQSGIGNKANTGHDTWIGSKASADLTVLGAHISNVVDMGAQATADGGTQGSRAWLEVAGRTLFDQPISAGIDYHQTVTFAEVSTSIRVASVSASAVGAIGVTGEAAASASGMSVNVTPSAQISAAADASVGWGLEASIYANLTLLDVELPARGNLQVMNGGQSWAFDSSAEISSLSGNVSLDIEACFDVGFWSTCSSIYSCDLVSWGGVSASYPLQSGSGCL